MATIVILSLQTGKHLPVSRQTILRQIEHTEKKNFSRHEAFDFHMELKKRNVELVIILHDSGIAPREIPNVAAYAVFVQSKRGSIAILHKICVLEKFRRKGIAKKVLATQFEKYTSRGCSKMQLWVDEQNVPARSLYESAGFRKMNEVVDYYAPGRTGFQMSLDLIS